MSGDIATAFVRIRPNTAGFRQEAEAGVKGAFGGIGKILGGALAVGGLADFGFHAAKAASEQQASLAAVEKAVKSSGASWKYHGQTVDTVLEAMARKSGQTVPDLAQGFLRIETATHDTAKSIKDLQLVEDVAIARHMGVAQAALAVSKAEQGSSTALQRLGIVVPKINEHYAALKRRHDEAVASGVKFSKQQNIIYHDMLTTAKAQDLQASKLKILDVLQQRFGGQTATFAATAAGKYAIAKESLHQFEVSLGNIALPLMSQAFTALAHWGVELERNTGVHQAFASVVHSLADGFHLLAAGIGEVWPVAKAVGGAFAEIAGAIGVPTILVGIAAYKSVAVAMSLAAAAEARWNAFIALGAPAKAAEVSETAALTAANVELAAALSANTAALQLNVTAATETTVIYGSLGEEIAVVGTAAAGTAVELEATGAALASVAAEEAAVGVLAGVGSSLAAIALGPVGIGVALAGIATGLYLLSQREGDVNRANDSLKQSFNQLRTAEDNLTTDTDALSSSLSALPTAKIALDTAKLGTEQAKAALGHGKAAQAVLALADAYSKHQITQAQFIQQAGKVQGPLAFREQVNQLVSALDGQRVAQRNVDQTEKDIHSNRTKRHTDLLAQYSAAEHEIARAQKLADKDMGIGFLTGAQHVKLYAAALNSDVTPGLKKSEPLVAHNIQLLRSFTLAIGQVPKSKDIKIILSNKDAKKGLAEVVTETGAKLADAKTQAEQGTAKLVAGVHAKLAAEKRPAGSAGTAIGVSFMQGIANEVDAWGPILAAKLDAAILGAIKHTKHTALVAWSPSQVTARELGVPMMEGISAGVYKGQQGLRNQLATSLNDAIQGGIVSIHDSVAQAHSSLTSIGSNIGNDVGAYIDEGLRQRMEKLDFGPLARKIKTLDDSLSLKQRREQTQGLNQALAAAQQNLADVQRSGGTAGETPEQYRQRLGDAAKQVADATQQVADNDAQNHRDDLQRRLDAEKAHAQRVADLHKQAATRRISNLTEELNRGIISEKTYQRELGKILGAEGVTYAALGRRMGIAFADQFRAEMKGLAKQEQALLAGPRLPGVTGFEPSIVRPIEAVRQAILAVEQAKAERDKQILAELKKLNQHAGSSAKKGKKASSTHTVTDKQAIDVLSGGAKR